jgi:hypothetical protein
MNLALKFLILVLAIFSSQIALCQVTTLSGLVESSPDPYLAVTYDIRGLQNVLLKLKTSFPARTTEQAPIPSDIPAIIQERFKILTKNLTGDESYFGLQKCDDCLASGSHDLLSLTVNPERVQEMLSKVSKKEEIPVLDFLLAHEYGHLLEGRISRNGFVSFPTGTISFDLDMQWIDPTDSQSFSEKTPEEQLKLTRAVYYMNNVSHTMTDAIGIALIENSGLKPCGGVPLMNYLIQEINNMSYLTPSEKARSLNNTLYRKMIWAKAFEKTCKKQ